MTPNKLASILSAVQPFTPKVVQLYRQHRNDGQLIPPVPENNRRVGLALTEVIDLGNSSSKLVDQLSKLDPVAMSSQDDQDMFGC